MGAILCKIREWWPLCWKSTAADLLARNIELAMDLDSERKARRLPWFIMADKLQPPQEALQYPDSKRKLIVRWKDRDHG